MFKLKQATKYGIRKSQSVGQPRFKLCLNFNAIKKILSRQEQVAETAVEETRNDLIIQNQNLETFIKMLTIEITKNVEEVVTTKVEALTNELHNIKKSNMEMQEQLLNHQQEHFKNVDEKLNKWREESNKGFFLKIFGNKI